MVHQRIDKSIPWTSVQRKQESDAIAPVVQKKPDALPTADSEAQTQEPGSRFNHNFAQIPLHSPDAPVSASYKVIADRQRIPFTPATQRTPMPLQAKLTIGQPEDRYEQEADRVASQVVKQIHAPAPAQPTLGQSAQRQGDPEDLQAKPNISSLQRSPSLAVGEAIAGGEASPDLASTLNRAGSGQPLDPALQQSMGQAMGADFSRVRVHTDGQADQLNRSLQAKAFTTGQDVFFRQGTYEPSSLGGQKLIAHELTHVVQQNGGAAINSPRRQPVDLLLQRAVVEVSGGEFEDIEYRAEDGEYGKGAFVNLEFRTNESIGEDGATVSLVQTVNDRTQRTDPKDNSDATLHPTTSQLGNRKLKADEPGVEAEDVGTGIDQEVLDKDKNVVNVDPRYTEQRLSEHDPLNTTGRSKHPQSVRSATKTAGRWSKARLNDAPEVSLKLPGFHWRNNPVLAQLEGGMEFEVAALNNADNEFIGSVKWGWKMNNGHAEIDPATLTLADEGSATPRFFKAAEKWNKTKISDVNSGFDHEPMQLPIDRSKLGHDAEEGAGMLQDAMKWVSENPGKTILGMAGATMLAILFFHFKKG